MTRGSHTLPHLVMHKRLPLSFSWAPKRTPKGTPNSKVGLGAALDHNPSPSLSPLITATATFCRNRTEKEEEKAEDMQPGARRRARNSAVVAGSVWERRMKMDEVKGGIKVFNAEKETNADEAEGIRVFRRLRRNQSDGGGGPTNSGVGRKKRRNWKPPEPVADNKNPIQLRKARSELLSRDELEEEEDEEDDEIEIEIEGEIIKNFDDKEIDLQPPPPPPTMTKAMIAEVEKDDEKKIQEIVSEMPVSFPPPAAEEIEKDLNPVKMEAQPIEIEEEVFEIGSEAQNRMQNIVDLVMWRDISKSAFVFGFGTFILLSSSYAKDIDFSLLSAISYLGLIYLALIFLYKSILRRGGVEFDEREGERCIIGQEEAIWALRFLLPYINEVLINVKALFSGDPATTMKLAVLLFVMARCGSSVTVWTLAKLVFFGVFTVPKVLSCYSVQLAKYGKFWVERFRDGWESCTHKKAFAAAIFTLIWNISSTVARIWAVFMLVVAVKLYQQCAVEWNAVDDEDDDCQRSEVERIVVEKAQRQEDPKAATVAAQSPGKSLQNHHRQLRNGSKREIKAKKWT